MLILAVPRRRLAATVQRTATAKLQAHGTEIDFECRAAVKDLRPSSLFETQLPLSHTSENIRKHQKAAFHCLSLLFQVIDSR